LVSPAWESRREQHRTVAEERLAEIEVLSFLPVVRVLDAVDYLVEETHRDCLERWVTDGERLLVVPEEQRGMLERS
jgi:hypothetical protein